MMHTVDLLFLPKGMNLIWSLDARLILEERGNTEEYNFRRAPKSGRCTSDAQSNAAINHAHRLWT